MKTEFKKTNGLYAAKIFVHTLPEYNLANSRFATGKTLTLTHWKTGRTVSGRIVRLEVPRFRGQGVRPKATTIRAWLQPTHPQF